MINLGGVPGIDKLCLHSFDFGKIQDYLASLIPTKMTQELQEIHSKGIERETFLQV